MLHVNGYPGLYIVFEGGVGVGKTVQISRTRDELQTQFPQSTFVFGREPGTTPVAEELRPALKNKDLDPEVKAALFHAARVETIKEFIVPNMREGNCVLMDRSFISSLANQGEGEKVGFDAVWKLNEGIVSKCWPDVVVFLTRETDKALMDSSKNLKDSDHWDTKGEHYHERVRLGYLKSLGLFREKHRHTYFILVDGTRKTEEEVFQDIWQELHPLVMQWGRELNEGKIDLENSSGGVLSRERR
jgi:dTMP kinase